MTTKTTKTPKSDSKPKGKPSASPKGKKKGDKGERLLTHANGAGFSPQRPGVLAYMLTLLCRATQKSPISKGELLDALCAEFPEREREKMKTTIAMQVPSGFRLEKGIIVNVLPTTEGKRYWVDASAPRLPKGERHVNTTE